MNSTIIYWNTCHCFELIFLKCFNCNHFIIRNINKIIFDRSKRERLTTMVIAKSILHYKVMLHFIFNFLNFYLKLGNFCRIFCISFAFTGSSLIARSSPVCMFLTNLQNKTEKYYILVETRKCACAAFLRYFQTACVVTSHRFKKKKNPVKTDTIENNISLRVICETIFLYFVAKWGTLLYTPLICMAISLFGLGFTSKIWSDCALGWSQGIHARE